MSAPRFQENPHYRDYESLLLQLHELFVRGKEDSPEADLVREQMDIPGSWLSQPEIDRLGGLSGDLYQIQDDEIYTEVKDSWQAAQLADQVDVAIRENRWDDVLELVRTRPSSAPAHAVANLRARAYLRLGHPSAALLFAEFALERKHDSGAYRYMVLDLTQEVHGISAALSLTDTYTCSSTDDLWWLSRVVPLLLVAGDKGDISLRPRWERVLDCLTSLLTSLEFGETPEIVVVYSGLGVAISFAELDKTEKAAEWYQWALNRARLSGIDQEVEKDFGPLFKDPDISAFPTATEQSTVTSAFQNITRLISPLILQEIYRLESNVPTRSEQRAITS